MLEAYVLRTVVTGAERVLYKQAYDRYIPAGRELDDRNCFGRRENWRHDVSKTGLRQSRISADYCHAQEILLVACPIRSSCTPISFSTERHSFSTAAFRAALRGTNLALNGSGPELKP